MFFTFCVLSTQQTNSKMDIAVDSSCHAPDIQHHAEGIINAGSFPEIKYQHVAKKIIPLHGINQQMTSTFSKISVWIHRYYRPKTIRLKPPARKLLHLNLYCSTNNDDDPFSVA